MPQSEYEQESQRNNSQKGRIAAPNTSTGIWSHMQRFYSVRRTCQNKTIEWNTQKTSRAFCTGNVEDRGETSGSEKDKDSCSGKSQFMSTCNQWKKGRKKGERRGLSSRNRHGHHYFWGPGQNRRLWFCRGPWMKYRQFGKWDYCARQNRQLRWTLSIWSI